MENDEIVERINTMTDGLTVTHYGVEDLLEIKRLASQLTVASGIVLCPYCNHEDWNDAKPLVDVFYGSCNLAVENRHWVIQLWGEDAGEEPVYYCPWGEDAGEEPVSYCPMCGRYLGDEVDEND